MNIIVVIKIITVALIIVTINTVGKINFRNHLSNKVILL